MSREETVFGWHAVMASLKYEPGSVSCLWIEEGRRDNRMRQLREIADRHRITVREAQGVVLDRMAGGRRHQGIVARCAGLKVYNEQELDGLIEKAGESPLLLALDQVQDPHNLGACMRSADAAGVCAVIAPADRSVGLTGTVRKVASGGAETVPFVQVVNLARALRALKERGLTIIGGAGDAERSIYETDLTGPTVLVLGAEEAGLRRLVREACDTLARIPMKGTVESLNVSVAAGVFLFETMRQRGAGVTRKTE